MSQYLTDVAVCVALLSLILPGSATTKCSDLTDIVDATSPKAQFEVVENVLQKIVPDLFDSLAGSTESYTNRLDEAYSHLAERFGEKSTRAGLTRFIEAVNAISIAQSEACSGSSRIDSTKVTELIEDFMQAFSRREKDLDRVRSIFGKLLCIDSLSTTTSTHRIRRQTGCAVPCNCPPGGLSDVVCTCQFFRCLDPDNHLKPIFGFSPTGLQCLAFVIDTTGSMGNEINTARQVILEFLKSEEQIGILGCYLLIPFNDNGSPATSMLSLIIYTYNVNYSL